MVEESTSIWHFTALGFYLLWAILILISFRLAYRFIPGLKLARNVIKSIRRWLLVAELVTWIILLNIAAAQFDDELPLLALTLITFSMIIVVILGWYYLRDLIIGFLLRFNGFISLGDQIEINEIKGKLIKLSYQGLIIETNQSTVFLPYSMISGQVLKRNRKQESHRRKSYQFPVGSSSDAEELRSRIAKASYLAPNVSLNEPPEITIRDSEGETIIEVNVYLIDPEKHKHTETYLRGVAQSK